MGAIQPGNIMLIQVQGTTQGSGAKLPPIPQMDKSAPSATSDAQTAAQARQMVREQVRAAVRSVVQAAAPQAPAPATPKIVGQAPRTDPAQTTSSTAPPATLPGSNNDIPEQIVPMLGIFFGTTLAIVLGFPIVRVLARRFDRNTEKIKAGASDVTPQLRQLQDSVDAMAIEIERISEGQRFTSKLLAERAGEKGALEAPKQG